MKTVTVSSKPQKAPADYRDLAPRVVVSDGDGLWETWHGSGRPTNIACASCGNVESNLRIYGNSGVSYPNGSSWDDAEVVCGACGMYTLVLIFVEG